MSTMIRLVARTPDGVLRFSLPLGREVSLGTDAGCDVTLPFRGVSGRHAVLRVKEGRVEIRDAGSKNGLYVNDQRVESCAISPESPEVQIGEVFLGLEALSSSDERVEIRLVEGEVGTSGEESVQLLNRTRLSQLTVPEGMVLGPSAAMQGLLDQIRATVDSWLDVLLLGETGSGKELFAKLIHQSGPTRDRPFVAINCAAIPRELLEAELFGVERRVATGVDPRTGLFLEADGGTIFLDEIAEMPEALQVKLLRTVQEREVLPVGGSKPKRVRLRVISASNQRIPTLAREGRFRADLYYRLRGLQFHIPPLRDRREDVPALVKQFVVEAAERHEKTIRGVSRRALRILMEYPWPGNVRELKTEVERAVLVCPHGGTLESGHFAPIKWAREHSASGTFRFLLPGESPAPDVEVLGGTSPPRREAESGEELLPLAERIEKVERHAIRQALEKTGGNKAAAARLLGITRNGLALKMKRLGIEG